MKIQIAWLGVAVALNGLGVATAQTVTSATAVGASGDQLTEIVVTAERRHTDLQTTPISATVISGGDLANLRPPSLLT